MLDSTNETNQSINLLEPVLEPEDIWSKTYDWITSIGRILLVITEIIVLGVFFTRFVYDGQNNDLTEEINGKISTVLSRPESRSDERDFRRYMSLFKDIERVQEGQKENSRKVSLVLDTLPNTLSLQSIALQGDNVSLSLTAQSFADVSSYTTRLNGSQQYSDVHVSVSKDLEADGQLIAVTVMFNIEEF